MRTIVSIYGSLDEPDFSFLSAVMATCPYSELIEELRYRFEVEEYTDVNYEVSFQFVLRDATGARRRLELSMLGRYAVLTRLPAKQPSAVITQATSGIATEEAAILSILERHDVVPLDAVLLAEPVKLRLNSADPENVRVYQALFVDSDFLPWGATGFTRPG